MTKFILQITKMIVTILAVLLLQSCMNSNWNRETLKGNGTVVEVNRTIDMPFNAIAAQTGLEVIIRQDNNVSVKVEADENLQDHIFTEVKDGELKIHTDVNILNCKAKKIYVCLPNLNKISSSSGASVSSEKELNFENLELESSSGSLIDIVIKSNTLSCESSSGSSITAKGTAKSINTESSSGSSINLEKLIAENGQSSSSSGSTTHVNVTNELKAEASSGSSISVASKPNSLIKDENSGGSVDIK
ncbi:conserved hypothetical protein [Flavobacterium sp. 9AF]|uniref:head GIN domain-containing protein n=1 Tax=Flavobacterium sp. 9AF TaxID=2653142 RepID=UPI0012EF5304|nr:head GIN domain-containing protein [Flavobacterium sp. 9AF]VXC23184.1 conserved hypothetical protein [Flavobacterium sp. 9AF]